MDSPLYSTRAGRSRKLSVRDFITLLWRSVIVPTNKQALLAEALAGPMKDADAFLFDRLNTSAIPSDDLFDTTPSVFMSPDEDVVFDLLELLYAECVSVPGSIKLDDYGNETIEGPFDRDEGRRIFRELLNPVLARHSPPFEMRRNGHIIELPPPTMQSLVDEPIPDSIEPALREPVDAAIDRFYGRGATETDRPTRRAAPSLRLP